MLVSIQFFQIWKKIMCLCKMEKLIEIEQKADRD